MAELMTAFGVLAERYGLPFAMLAALLWLLLTRRFVLGSELRYVEERRVEEREGRLTAEATTRTLTGAVETLGGSMENLTDSIVAAVERALEEDRREEGRRARRST